MWHEMPHIQVSVKIGSKESYSVDIIAILET